MRKYLLCCFVFGVFYHSVVAQQAAQYTQYMVNPYLMNPALSSVEDMIDIKTGVRSQWVGFQQTPVEGSPSPSSESIAPRTMYLTGHTPIGRPHNKMHYVGEAINWFGVGGKVVYDKTGPSTWGSYMLSATYNTGLIKPKGSGVNTYGGLRMSAGMFFGIQQYSLDWDKLRFGNNFSEPMRATNSGMVTKFMPDATVGIWLYNDFAFFGLSSDHLFGNRIDFAVTDDQRNQEGTLARHLFLTSGFNYKVAYQWVWTPSVLMKFTPNAPLSIDVNNKVTYEDKFWGGLTYRHLDAISVAAGFVYNYHYEFAYSYDFTTTDIRVSGRAFATHEIMVGYRIAPKYVEKIAEEHNKKHSGHRIGKKLKKYRQ